MSRCDFLKNLRISDETLTQLRNSVRSGGEFVLNVGSAVNLIYQMVNDVSYLYSGKEWDQMVWTAWGALGPAVFLSLVDSIVHYITYQSERYREEHGKMPLIPSDASSSELSLNSTSPLLAENKKTCGWLAPCQGFLAWGCRISETLGLAGTPAAAISLFLQTKIMMETRTLRITRLLTSSIMIPLSFYATKGDYLMAQKHLNEAFSNDIEYELR